MFFFGGGGEGGVFVCLFFVLLLLCTVFVLCVYVFVHLSYHVVLIKKINIKIKSGFRVVGFKCITNTYFSKSSICMYICFD